MINSSIRTRRRPRCFSESLFLSISWIRSSTRCVGQANLTGSGLVRDDEIGTFQAEWSACSDFQRTSRRYTEGAELACIFSALLNLGEEMYHMPNHAYLLPLFARAPDDPKDGPRPPAQGAVKRSRCCTTRGIKKKEKELLPASEDHKIVYSSQN